MLVWTRLARLFIGQFNSRPVWAGGISWVAAGVLTVLWAINAIFIRESPSELALPEPETNPNNHFGPLGEEAEPEKDRPLVATLTRKRAPSWTDDVARLDSLELFNNWTPTYLVEAVGLSSGSAAQMTSLFPFLECFRAWPVYLGDRLGRVGRAVIILTGVLLGGLTLGLLGWVSFARQLGRIARASIASGILFDRACCLAGAISLDFGGQRAAQPPVEYIDGVGYMFGGVIAGKVVSPVSDSLGWQGVFQMFAVVAFLTVRTAGFLVTQLRHGNSGLEALQVISQSHRYPEDQLRLGE